MDVPRSMRHYCEPSVFLQWNCVLVVRMGSRGVNHFKFQEPTVTLDSVIQTNKIPEICHFH